MTNTIRTYLLVLAVVGTLAGYYAWRRTERAIGARDIRLASADSVHRVDSLMQVALHDSTRRAVAAADSLRRVARQEVAKDAQTRRHADSTLEAASSERAAALRVAADSGATVDSLRAAVREIAASGVADSLAFAREWEQGERTLRTLLTALAADSVAIQQGLRDTEAALRRAGDAERQRDLYRAAQPGFLRQHFAITIGYGATDKGLGPAVVAGLRIWP